MGGLKSGLEREGAPKGPAVVSRVPDTRLGCLGVILLHPVFYMFENVHLHVF